MRSMRIRDGVYAQLWVFALDWRGRRRPSLIRCTAVSGECHRRGDIQILRVIGRPDARAPNKSNRSDLCPLSNGRSLTRCYAPHLPLVRGQPIFISLNERIRASCTGCSEWKILANRNRPEDDFFRRSLFVIARPTSVFFYHRSTR